MTIEHIRWFALQAAKKDFDAGHWAVYCCLAADCAIARTDVLYTTKTALAARVHLGKSRVEKVLADLSSANLVRTDASGCIGLVQPDPSWANRINANPQPNQSKISLNDSRAQKAAAEVEPPQRGSTTSGQNLPSGLPPRNENQAKPLTARKIMQMYEACKWTIPMELRVAFNTAPDEPFEVPIRK